MAKSGRQNFEKRLREKRRLEKRAEKQEKKAQRKADKDSGIEDDSDIDMELAATLPPDHPLVIAYKEKLAREQEDDGDTENAPPEPSLETAEKTEEGG